MRRTPTRRTMMTLLVAVAALLLAACGGDDAAVPAGGGADPAPTPRATPGATGQDGALAGDPCAEDPQSEACLAQGAGDPAPELPELDGDDISGGLAAGTGGDLFNPVAFVGDDLRNVPSGEDEEGSDIPSISFGDDFEQGGVEETPTTTTTTTTTFTPTYTGAKVWLNHETYQVSLDTAFPDDEQLFRVTSVSASSMTFELVAGEFSGGSTGITIAKGSTKTLVNQNEGTQYQIRYDGPLTAASTR